MNYWIKSLKKYNNGKNQWCTPRKGTKEYDEVKKIMENLKEKDKKAKEPKVKWYMTMDEIMKNRKEAAKRMRERIKESNRRAKKFNMPLTKKERAMLEKAEGTAKIDKTPLPPELTGPLTTLKKLKPRIKKSNIRL